MWQRVAAMRKAVSVEQDPNRWYFFGVAWAAWLVVAGVDTLTVMTLIKPENLEAKKK